MNAAREVLPRADVLIRDGRILQVGGRLRAGKGARQVIDASGSIVLPGLIHGHLHACQTLFRGHADGLEFLDWLKERIWPFEAAHDEKSMRASADLTFAELIKSGATAALDMGTAHHTDVIFESARDCGFRLMSGKAMMDFGDALPRRLRDTTRASVDESVSLCRAWNGAADDRLRYAFAPRFVLSCTDALLEEVAHLSKTLGARVHTHASENPSECEAVRSRFGLNNVALLHRLGLTGPHVTLAHCVWLEDAEVALLEQTQTSVCHCPSSNLKLASGIAKIP